MNKNRTSNNYDGKIAGLYDLGDTLGRGHFAIVKLAKHVFTGEQVAVKVIDKTKLDEVSRAHLFQEVRCMKLVQHPNVVRLYEVIDTQTKLYLILEFGDGGDMYDYIMKHEKGVDEETAKKYFRQIVNAISYCHKLHVVHRDLKPENVVFFEKLGVVKLTDFGFSNKFCPGQKLETSCGSLAYSAPEILLGDSYDAPKVDVWSLGVILYMMVCGHAPFQEANDSETLTMIMDCKYTVPSYISVDCRSLIQRMLIRDPEKRATLEQISSDMWLSFGITIHTPECLPLVSGEQLSEEDNNHIIQKMVNGNIAPKEDILDALEKNEYNHITATFYLLAERKLRMQRHEKAQMSRLSRADLSPVAVTPGISSTTPSPAQEKMHSTDGLLSPCLPSNPIVESTSFTNVQMLPLSNHPMTLELPKGPLTLGRKCSIVREEEDSSASAANSPTKSPLFDPSRIIAQDHLGKIMEDNSAISLSAENLYFISSHVPLSPPPAFNIHSVKSSNISNHSNNSTRPKLTLTVTNNSAVLRNQQLSPQSPDKKHSRTTTPSPGTPAGVGSPTSPTKSKTLPAGNRRLHSVQSSPQLLLNEINEESETESTTVTHHSQLRHHHSTSGTTEHHKKQCYLSKLQSHGTAVSHAMLRIMGQRHKFTKHRTASCSSSDASDDERENLKRRMGKLKTPNNNNRRSRDRDQNGKDGRGGGGASGGRGGGHGGEGQGDGNGGACEGEGGGNQDERKSPHGGDPGFSPGNNCFSRASASNNCSLENSLDMEEGELDLQSAHLSHVVFSTDSTDSLDLIEPQPRLVSSVSCGDLSADVLPSVIDKVVVYTAEAEDVIMPMKSPSSAGTPAHHHHHQHHNNRDSESIRTSTVDLPSSAADISLSAKLRSKLSNSLSLNSGLSCLQNSNNCNSTESLSQPKGLHISKLVPKSPTRPQLDINQNGWKKHGSSSAGKQPKSVMDVKMASKCCTLC